MKRYLNNGFYAEVFEEQFGVALLLISNKPERVTIECCREVQVAVSNGRIAGIGMGQLVASIRNVVDATDE